MLACCVRYGKEKREVGEQKTNHSFQFEGLKGKAKEHAGKHGA